MARSRRLGIFLVRVLKNWPPFSPPCPPAGGPAQMVLGGNLRSFPKPEMEADTYLGGRWEEVSLGAGSQALPRKPVSRWPPWAQGPGMVLLQLGVVSLQAAQAAWFPTPISQHSFSVFQDSPLASGCWQKSCSRHPGAQTRDKQGETGFSSQKNKQNFSAAPFPLKAGRDELRKQKKLPRGL